MKKSIALTIAAGTLFLAGCSTCHPPSKAWEYRVITYSWGSGLQQSSLDEKLNKVGAEGFIIESVQTLPAKNEINFPSTVVILKRAKPD